MKDDLTDYLKDLVHFINISKELDQIHLNNFLINLDTNKKSPWIRNVNMSNFDDIHSLVSVTAEEVDHGQLDAFLGENEYLKRWLSQAKRLNIRNQLERFYPHGVDMELFQKVQQSNPITFGNSLRCVYGLNPKKCHEVQRLSLLIGELCKMEKIENIVDIGCGQCYLSTHLAFNEHFQVLAIDRDLNQIKAAKDRSVKLQSVIKDGTMGYQDRLSLIHEEVDDSFLEEKFGNRRGNDEDVRPWCMTSLHACGGLSVSMIKSFVSLQQCCLLVNLGCCYHLLDKELIYERGVHYDHEYDSDNAEDNAFPISKAVKCLKGQLSYSLRSLACQVPHRWLDDDFNPLQGLVITFNRSLFQWLLKEYGLHNGTTNIILGKLKHPRYMNIHAFCETAFDRLKIPQEQRISAAAIDQAYDRFARDQFSLHLVFTLRVILGPVVESLILLDRFLYLKENGFNPFIYPVFDEHVSPRNLAIVCKKDGNGVQ